LPPKIKARPPSSCDKFRDKFKNRAPAGGFRRCVDYSRDPAL
jgi:hypothetical protein